MGADLHICYKKSFVKRYIATYQPEVLAWHQVPSPRHRHHQRRLLRQDISLFDMASYTGGKSFFLMSLFFHLSRALSLSGTSPLLSLSPTKPKKRAARLRFWSNQSRLFCPQKSFEASGVKTRFFGTFKRRLTWNDQIDAQLAECQRPGLPVE